MTITKTLILIFALLSVRLAHSQSRCGVILDNKTLNSVAYASISSPTSNIFIFTDGKGKYCLDNISLRDTIYISALGYKRLIVNDEKLSKSDSVFMISEPIQLKAVKIVAKKNSTKTQNVGFFKGTSLQSKNSFAPNSNMKVAVYLKNTAGTNNVLSRVYYRLKPHPSDIASFFRVRFRIYENGVRNLPANDLLTNNIVLDVSPEQTLIAQDILKENISIPPDGLWLGIETVGYVDKSGNYHPSGTGEIGRVTFKNSKKMETEKIFSISPYYRTSREERGSSAKKPEVGQSRWSDFKFLDDKLTFMFGAEVLVGK